MERQEFRGVGEIHSRQPIAAVLEVLRRAPGSDGRWNYVRPFTGIPDGAEYAFQIMQSVTTTTVQRGTKAAPAREPHPQFEKFNTCHPSLARTLRCRLVNWQESDAYAYWLGAYQAPGKQEGAQKGWWCRGDGKCAQRWDGKQFQSIPCPGELCEFQQEKYGPKGNQAHCKPNLRLIAQFNWSDQPDGRPNPLPKVVFQLDSKSWNNIANANGLFDMIHKITEKMGYARGQFPIFNLCFTMNLKERVKGQKKFPEISFSLDTDLMDWIGKVHQLEQSGSHQIAAPKPLHMLPAGECTPEDMERATEVSLSPSYKPANVREV